MRFDWSEFLRFAVRCYDGAQTRRLSCQADPGEAEAIGTAEEAVFRTAASRAYYAVHHLAAELVERTDGLAAGDRSSRHQWLYGHMKGSHRRSWKKIGHNLQRLHEIRLKADYDAELLQRGRRWLPANLANEALCQARTLAKDITEALPASRP